VDSGPTLGRIKLDRAGDSPIGERAVRSPIGLFASALVRKIHPSTALVVGLPASRVVARYNARGRRAVMPSSPHAAEMTKEDPVVNHGESTDSPPRAFARQPAGARAFRLFGDRATSLGDRVFHGLSVCFALLILVITLVMVVTLTIQAWPTITRFGWGFLTSAQWNPVVDRYGALTFLFGTLYTSLFALVLAVPLSLGVAIFLAELAPRSVRGPATMLVELLAAIPSVVYGLWGIYVLTAIVQSPVEGWLGAHFGWIPLFSGPAYGSGILAAILILTIMIVPTITAISTDLLRRVPTEQREGMLALGATHWETITQVVLPYARSGIIGAVILGLGRAVGETMAVTMVIGNGRYIGPSLFAVTDTMASVIANQFSEATGTLYPAALLELGLLLFLMSMALNMLARLLVWRFARLGDTR